jgi:hypothetical protein
MICYLSYSSAQHFTDTWINEYTVLCQLHVINTIMKVYRQTKFRRTFLYSFSIYSSKHMNKGQVRIGSSRWIESCRQYTYVSSVSVLHVKYLG